MSNDNQILVHADGGDCHGFPIGPDGRCIKCHIHPDTQSTELWDRSLINYKPVCDTCFDTHLMELKERLVPCTHCPRPCPVCSTDGRGAYCASTPCHCRCHLKHSDRIKENLAVFDRMSDDERKRYGENLFNAKEGFRNLDDALEETGTPVALITDAHYRDIQAGWNWGSYKWHTLGGESLPARSKG